jgi:hypothetical protein
MDAALARTVWHRLETINAVTYFAPECRQATDDLGLKGFWMGYFACRAAPMGQVTAGVVDATFFNFHPDRIRRAIPDAWTFAHPGDVVIARASSAAVALRRLLGDDVDRLAEEVLPDLRAAVGVADGTGRALFAANRELALPADPVAALWQSATALREHRGDGHVALLTTTGLDGCETLVLFSATEGLPPELFRLARGWSEHEWVEARERLQRRGLVTEDGSATDTGRTLRSEIERRTDELAVGPFAVLGDRRVDELIDHLDGPARQISGAEAIVYPNPMGLPPLATEGV